MQLRRHPRRWLRCKSIIVILVSTHFAIIVEVRVKADTVTPSGLQVHQRRRVGIVLGEIHIELKAAVGVRGIAWTCDQNLEIQSKQNNINHTELEVIKAKWTH